MNDLQNRIESAANNDYLQNAFFVIDHLQKAVGYLKTNKHDDHMGLYSDSSINGTPKLFTMLVKIFNCMLVHGYSPEDMLRGTLSPIVKDKRGRLNE